MSKTILGGGITGLSAAHYLRRKFPLENITLLEASNRSGGWIKSIKHDGFVFEQGPRTIRPYGVKGANTLELIEDIGLTDEVQYISRNHPAARNRMVYVNGNLHTLPSRFSSLFTVSPPFSKPLVKYLVKEYRQSPKIVQDESIYDFVQRRFGTEIADYAVSPLICGICAGDAKEISVKFLMDSLFKNEQKYGSITKGFINNVFKKSAKVKSPSTLVKRSEDEKWSVFYFENGLEVLPQHLEKVNKDSNHVRIELGQNVSKIDVARGKVTIHIGDDDKIDTRHLISTISAKKLAELISGHEPLKELLNKIPFVTVGVVNLHYKGDYIKNKGFGFLVPPKENLPILGVIFDSCCFPCEGSTNLTVMMGGHWFKSYFGDHPSKEHLLKVAMQQLEDILEINESPELYQINILKDCIPQYVVGHSDTINKITNYIAANELPLSLCGTSYNGVGINDAIYSAKTIVDNLQN